MRVLFRALRHAVKWIAIGFSILVPLTVIGAAALLWAIIEPDSSRFGTIPDEAKAAGRSPASLAAANDPYFVRMDKGILALPPSDQPYRREIQKVATLTGHSPEEVRTSAIRGQDMWLVWTGGNDRFWDFAASNTAGAFDLLKTVSSYKGEPNPMAYGRRNRWSWLGLVNEPCFTEANGPDPDRFGLWLDRRDPSCPADPFADQAKYPGVAVGARGHTVPVGSYYGEPTGVVGLRLFPNPDFDAAAQARWDPKRYYDDPSYYNDRNLVRPYRVGMACAFCHVGPSPVNPPLDPENPKWENLASNPGAQYFWVNRIFFWNTRPRGPDGAPAPNEGNFLYQLFHTNPPGTLDTSLVSSDYMNNPRTMNAVYDVLARLKLSLPHGREQLTGDERDNRQFQDYPITAALSQFWDAGSDQSYSMRILKDGSDSVGALGALNRVYLNIGLFSEEWLLHFRPFIGGQKISPIRIADAQKQSAYWRATEAQTPDMAVFFLVTAQPDKLADAPDGGRYLEPLDSGKVVRGKVIFAENCAACHSSRIPPVPANSGIDQGDCAGGGSGPNYRTCWDRYWTWAQSRDFKDAMVRLVAEKDANGRDTFLDENYLSSERRVPIDIVGTNACTAIATNGLKGDIWDNFTSTSYKTLPPPREVTVNHPVSGAAMSLRAPGNGRGYLRPPSLISLWSTAPFMSNNAVGQPKDTGFRSGSELPRRQRYGSKPPICDGGNDDDPYLPCVANRLKVFEHSIRQMLSPDIRRKDDVTTLPVPGYIYRTTAPSCLIIPAGYLPSWTHSAADFLHWLAPWAIDQSGGIALGPLPAGFPVNALTNTKLLPDHDEDAMLRHFWTLLKAAPTLVSTFAKLGGQCSAKELADPGVQIHAEEVLRRTHFVDTLVGLSKCPDYIVNRGHTFGSDLSDFDKEALIAYLKHF
ncbi:MAG: hypothetical protein AB7O80_19115 [Acetobacteraceae bacterium]